ncbi:MAG: chaperone modulator CbpM [Cytophagales bacterium]|jgi:vacuolar-type H+-ATPase subunit I/STV1|nr:chaperone modulator CbpM [Cytophagales bacterium]MCA6367314.1 chaperone modulator CbpM [Cytophagales bacterium]MCA6371671.1 chaperone modulator CbpM [Cytophagales bacterium]MCA6376201.1 chaperone modulator CbpM [Cytophagales bacterium]MCA6384021.1 chaperone modulator CbpM [Cytophagales bacterium]
MENRQLIPVADFCDHYHIEFSFVRSLHDFGLVEFTTVKEVQYLRAEDLTELEKMARLHYELDINMEGIDAIKHILQRMDKLQQELNSLKSRLNLYERSE